MKHTIILTVLFVASVTLASASELKLTGELHCDSLEVTLQNSADYEVYFALKFDLKEKTGGEWKLVDSLNCSVNSSIAPLASLDLNCSYAAPGKPGEYKIYARATIVNSTYTYKDFLFNVGENGTAAPKEKKRFEAVSIEVISAPEKVKTGEEFFVVANITAGRDASLEVYSYVYEGKTCYSFLGWKGNSQKAFLKAGEWRLFNLSDSVKHGAANGTYSLKIRAREPSGDSFKDYDAVRPLEVEQVPVDLFKEIPKTQDRGSKTGDSRLPLGLILPVLGSVPLLMLLLKKIL